MKLFPYLVIECDTLPENYHNTIIHAPNGTLYGSRVEISCPSGYKLEGANVITCLGTGQWSDPLSRCVKIEFPTTIASTPFRPRVTTRVTSRRPTTSTRISTTSTTRIITTTTTTTPTPEISDEGMIT